MTEQLRIRVARFRKAAAQATRRDQLICGRALAAHLEDEARELDRLLGDSAANRPIPVTERRPIMDTQRPS